MLLRPVAPGKVERREGGPGERSGRSDRSDLLIRLDHDWGCGDGLCRGRLLLEGKKTGATRVPELLRDPRLRYYDHSGCRGEVLLDSNSS